MKKQFLHWFSAFLLLFSLQVVNSTGQTVQLIHNAADPALDSVDIYIFGQPVPDLADFHFRTALTTTLPPGNYPIGIAPGNSTSAADILATFNLTLVAGHHYIAMATGVNATMPGMFSPNPEGRSTAVNLLVQDNIRTAAADTNNVDLIVMHGVTDAPAVDVVPMGVCSAAVVDSAMYGDFTGYLSLPENSYTLNVTAADNNANVVATYHADLNGLGGQAGIVFASGFLNPSLNQNGAAFGLFVALSNDTVVELPANTNALLQVIHNAADPNADSVDVYVNGTLTLDNFGFRQATSYLPVPGGVPLQIGVAPKTSTSVSDTIASFNVTLTAGYTYVAFANGVLDTTFAPNPSSRPIAFNLYPHMMANVSNNPGSLVNLTAFHGATDAPAVDVILPGATTPLIDNLRYGNYSATISVPNAAYVLNITPASLNNIVLASYDADLSSYPDASAVLFASGFLNPATNNSGPAFGLFAALCDGNVIELTPHQSARVQVIHNSADPAAASVDVYANGTMLIDNFTFRSATAYVDVPAGVPVQIGIAPDSSASALDTIGGLGTTVTFTNGHTYSILANGVTDPVQFAANPDGRPTAFTYFVKDGARETSSTTGNVDFFVVHGVTDAPTVDVLEGGATTLVNDAAYGDLTAYLSVPAASYSLAITPAAGAPIVAEYLAAFDTLANLSAVVFASGFFAPANNQNGPAFELWAALPNGVTFPLQVTTGVEEAGSMISGLYPNPAANELRLDLNHALTADSRCTITDAFGRTVKSFVLENGSTRMNRIDVSGLANGVYHLALTESGRTSAATFVISR